MKKLNWLLVALAMFGAASVAVAQPYPNRPIRLVVPFPAGRIAARYFVS